MQQKLPLPQPLRLQQRPQQREQPRLRQRRRPTRTTVSRRRCSCSAVAAAAVAEGERARAAAAAVAACQHACRLRRRREEVARIRFARRCWQRQFYFSFFFSPSLQAFRPLILSLTPFCLRSRPLLPTPRAALVDFGGVSESFESSGRPLAAQKSASFRVSGFFSMVYFF